MVTKTRLVVGGRACQVSWDPEQGLQSDRHPDLLAEQAAYALTERRDLMVEVLLELEHQLRLGADPSDAFLEADGVTVGDLDREYVVQSTNPYLLAVAACSSSTAIRTAAARNGCTSRRTLNRLLLDRHPEVRRAACCSPNLTPPDLHLLYEQGRTDDLVAHNPHTPPELLVEIARRTNLDATHLALARNPSFPPTEMHLLQTASRSIAKALSERDDTPGELIAAIASNFRLHTAIQHPSLPAEAARQLSASHPYQLVQSRSRLTVEIQQLLVQRHETAVRELLAERSDLALSVAQTLSQDKSSDVRRRLLQNRRYRHLACYAERRRPYPLPLKTQDPIEAMILEHLDNQAGVIEELRTEPEEAYRMLRFLSKSEPQPWEPYPLEQLIAAAEEGVTKMGEKARMQLQRASEPAL